MRSHGGRVRAIESGETRIDIAFYDGAKRTIELAKASGVYKGDL